MTEKLTVFELIKQLQKYPMTQEVKLSVNYDDCEHIQDLRSIYSYDEMGWLVLSGRSAKND